MFLLRKILFSFTIFLIFGLDNFVYAQSGNMDYDKIQESYSTDYSHLTNLYTSFFFPADDSNQNSFLIDKSIMTDDEKLTIKEPLGYDIKLQEFEPKIELKVGSISLEHKEAVDDE